VLESEVQIAGAQLDFPAQQDQEVGAVWVPFEEAIVIGWTSRARFSPIS